MCSSILCLVKSRCAREWDFSPYTTHLCRLHIDPRTDSDPPPPVLADLVTLVAIVFLTTFHITAVAYYLGLSKTNLVNLM